MMLALTIHTLIKTHSSSGRAQKITLGIHTIKWPGLIKFKAIQIKPSVNLEYKNNIQK